MKKLFLTLSLLIIFILLTGCKKTNTDNTGINPTPEPTNITDTDTGNNQVTPTQNPTITPTTIDNVTFKDYYPFKENVKYTYEGEGNEYASFIQYTDYVSENRIQVRTNNGGTESIRVIEQKDGELILRLLKGESYFRENLLEATPQQEEILLKEPIDIGTEWSLSDDRKRYISNTDVEITTPAGTYKAVEVTTEGMDDTIQDYYAPKVGLVKTIFRSEEAQVTSTLSKIEEDMPYNQIIQFFYPNLDEDVIYKLDKEIVFYTNDITRTKLEAAIKENLQEEYDPLLSTNTKINSLYLNKDNVVYVDFTKELIDEMNAGAYYESLILQCITNTLGTYYGVDKVYITVEGEPYESGHVLVKKGETFQVNLDKVVE